MQYDYTELSMVCISHVAYLKHLHGGFTIKPFICVYYVSSSNDILMLLFNWILIKVNQLFSILVL